MSADAVAAARLVGGCVLVWLAPFFAGCESLNLESLLRAAIGGGIGLFGYIYPFIVALKYGSAIDISIIMTIPPVFVILLEVALAGRCPSWLEYLGVIVSFAGAAMIIIGRWGTTRAGSQESVMSQAAFIGILKSRK